MSLPFFEFKVAKKPRKQVKRKPKVKPKATKKKVKPKDIVIFTKLPPAPRIYIAVYPANFHPLAGSVVAWGLTKADAQWMAARHANTSWPGMLWSPGDFDVVKPMKTGHLRKMTNNRKTVKR